VAALGLFVPVKIVMEFLPSLHQFIEPGFATFPAFASENTAMQNSFGISGLLPFPFDRALSPRFHESSFRKKH
jgi:hypothetical protein